MCSVCRKQLEGEKSDSNGLHLSKRNRRKKHKTVRFASAIVVISLPGRSTSADAFEVRESVIMMEITGQPMNYYSLMPDARSLDLLSPAFTPLLLSPQKYNAVCSLSSWSLS